MTRKDLTRQKTTLESQVESLKRQKAALNDSVTVLRSEMADADAKRQQEASTAQVNRAARQQAEQALAQIKAAMETGDSSSMGVALEALVAVATKAAAGTGTSSRATFANPVAPGEVETAVKELGAAGSARSTGESATPRSGASNASRAVAAVEEARNSALPDLTPRGGAEGDS